jgi:large subunit ribosomal protein L4
MPTVDILNLEKQPVGQVDLPPQIFDVDVKVHLIHEVVVAQMASRRSGTACTKGRSEIVGSSRKLYRQKGTGRARAGDVKSPLRRGGGTIFGPKPRDFSRRPPRKVRLGALKSALTAKLRDQELLVVDDFKMDEIKTKRFVSAMSRLGLNNALVVTPEVDDQLEKSSRNAANFKVLRADGLNCYDLLKYEHVVLLEKSISKIEERLLK